MGDKPRLWIGTVGTDFEPGVYDALERAAKYVSNQGCETVLDLMSNKCVQPHHGLAMMRNWIIINGLGERATHILLIDNDILLEDETVLERLLQADKEIIIPWFDQSCLGRPRELGKPMWGRGQGIKQIEWGVMSCILFKATIWTARGVDPRLFQDHLAITEEDYYLSYLRLFGLTPWQDTDAVVKLLRPPTALWDVSRSDTIEQHDDGKELTLHFRSGARQRGWS